MKPFDLDKALAGAKVVTRDGRPVTELHLFSVKREQPLYGVIDGELEQWYKTGQYGLNPNSNYDLFMAPTTRKEWVVRFSHQWIAGPYDSLEQAQKAMVGITPQGTIHEITIPE